MTDPAGDSCVWSPGNDGYCPSGGSGGSSPPRYNRFGHPQFVKVGGERRVVVRSDDSISEVYEEIELPDGSGLEPARVRLAIGATWAATKPSFACATVCVAGWRFRDDGRVYTMVRDEVGWTRPAPLAGALRPPAVAAFGDLVLVASTTPTQDGDNVWLWRLDLQGNVVGSWTVATGVSSGHLSLAASSLGGLVTWTRREESAGDKRDWVLVAQLLGPDGAPVGTPFEHPYDGDGGDYYRAAPSALVGGAYRVATEDAGAWFIVDPSTRTITATSLGDLQFSRVTQAIIPEPGGALLALSGNDGGTVLRVIDDRVVADVAVATDSAAPDVLLTEDGMRVAFGTRGSVYVADWRPDLELVGDPTVIAETYEAGGCSSGHGVGAGGLAVVGGVLVGRVRRRRR